MEVAPGVHRLTKRVVNFYMVEEGGKVTLVDAGASRDWALLVQGLKALGRSLDDIETVLLTHAHSDHTGFAERARTEVGAVVRVHSADASVAKGGKQGKNDGGFGPHLVRPQAYRTLFGLMLSGGLRIVPIAEVSIFEDGGVLDVPGRPRVVHAPGHTAGACALYFESRSVLCTGDSLVTLNPMTGRRGPQIMPAALNTSSAEALSSLDKLAGTNAELVLPGHGEPWTDGVALAVQAAHAAGRS
jgi:glyoxylase-like metal-dependent hydrolase (beta-lactamase superfamily II)